MAVYNYTYDLYLSDHVQQTLDCQRSEVFQSVVNQHLA